MKIKDRSPSVRLTRFLLALVWILGFSSPLFSGISEARNLQCQDIPQIADLYLRSHYVTHRLTDQLKDHTAAQFVKEIDPSKTLLLEKDSRFLRAEALKLLTTSEMGNCKGFQEISKTMISRVQEEKDFVQEYVGKDYQLDQSVKWVVNPEKRAYPKTLAERQELLKKMIHFQISNYLVSGIDLNEAKKNLVHRYELAVKRLKEKKDEDWIGDYLDAFANALDPHSSFLSRDSVEDFKIQMSLSLEGIGASLASRDGFTEIEEVIAGGAADRAKILRPKDKIIAVAPEGKKPVSVIDMDLREVVKLIRGAKGTRVVLTILRQGQKTETFDATIARDKINIEDQAASMSFQDVKRGDRIIKVGIIDFPGFYGDEKGNRSSSKDIQKLLEVARIQKVDGIVLDLSRNGGGLLQEAVKISGLFLKKGGIVATKDVEGKVAVLSSDEDHVAYSGPLVVLTSHLSASASEILAGALQDYKRALIVGTDRTFGKGSVQSVSGLPYDLGALKVTMGMFFLPRGESTQYRGVNSDIQFPSVFGDKEMGEKSMTYSLPPQKIAPFISPDVNSSVPTEHWTPMDTKKVQKLAKLSKLRVSKDPEFAKILKEISENEKKRDVISLAEIQKSAEENKLEKKKKEGESLSKRLKDLEKPMIQESVNILADLVAEV